VWTHQWVAESVPELFYAAHYIPQGVPGACTYWELTGTFEEVVEGLLAHLEESGYFGPQGTVAACGFRDSMRRADSRTVRDALLRLWCVAPARENISADRRSIHDYVVVKVVGAKS
jgi:hypothetical protein